MHYFISRFLDGEAKLLSIIADTGTFAKEHKSGAELWRLLVFNYEMKSAYTVESVVEMIKNVEKAKSMMDIQPKIATLERLYIEFAKGFNESDDTNIKDIGGLKHMAPVGYFDVFKKSDLLRILPDNVIKDLCRSPDVKLETNSYETLRNIVNQLLKDGNNATAPMDLDALKEADDEGNSSEGDGAKSGSVEESENVDDDNRFTVCGTDGCLYYLSMKGKGKSAGKGDSGRANGHCSWCGRYGHRVRECRDFTAHLQKGGAPIQGKGKGKSDSGKDGKVVSQITLEVSMRLSWCHFNSNTSQRFHS